MLWYIIPGTLLVMFLAWFVLASSPYQQLFGDEHLLEIHQRLPTLKRLALERVIDGEENQIETVEDPRSMVTEAGLLIVYTVSRNEGKYWHHWSISYAARGYTARAVGDMFTCFMARELGLDINRFALGVSPHTVHHSELAMTPAEHEAYAQKPIVELTPDDLENFRQAWRQTSSGRAGQWEQLSM